MVNCFVRIWECGKHTKTEYFYSVEAAWAYVIEHDIQAYSVYTAECIVDHSGKART